MIGFLLLIGGFILIFVAGWLNNTALMTMSFFLVLLSGAGLVTTAVSLALLRLSPVEWTGRAEKGLSGTVRVRLSSGVSPTLAPYIILKYRSTINNVKQKGSVRAPMYGGAVIELPFEASECGILRLSVTSVRAADLFGWFSFVRPCRITIEFPVFPDDTAEAPGAVLAEGRKEAAGNSRVSAARGTEVRDLSAYQAGDEARFIHWPASARLGQLMKKEYEEEERAVVSYKPVLPETIEDVDPASCRISADILGLLEAGYAVQAEGMLISSREGLDAYLEDIYKRTGKKETVRKDEKRQIKTKGSEKSAARKAVQVRQEGGSS